jgi:hypothetical protein
MNEATTFQADEAAIVAAAHALREETVTMLSELVTHPSLLGHEEEGARRQNTRHRHRIASALAARAAHGP